MPRLDDTPPDAVVADITALRSHLGDTVPSKRLDENLLIATWNIRAFASLTREWTAGSSDSPKRDPRGLLAIGEIIRRFDVVALQEIKGDLRALRDLVKWLGRDWAFLMTDVNLGAAGNSERMAFLYDRRRVEPSGLACELVVPEEWLAEVEADALRRQFARTPYAVSFLSGQQTFIVVTLHVDYGNSASERIPELKGIARWMSDWADRTSDWSQNLIALGDFNIDRKDDPLWQAFTSTGLTVASDLERVPRSIFANPSQPTTDKYYDQIAWFETDNKKRQLSLDYRTGGFVDFVPHVYRDLGLSRSEISYRVSDHYPLWVEFGV
ncbi:MAG: endonuclease/exonuclease/phosphatase family protein [Gammaproteobacteria bacterium]|nr:endonuclease/exonuclease/phosphatase family protein [Gammaproteobacteria bacterium]